MVTMFIALLVVVMSFNLFAISYQLNGINRLLLGIPMSIFESAVVLYNLEPNQKPYFDKVILIDNVHSYFDYSIVRYCDEYDIDIVYYDPISHAITFSDKPEAVKINITATLDFSYQYQKSMFYEIR
ncbi:MAG: hypothetical protein GXY27_03115 [Erysipelotrichaceae bacterium]|jgi:hypothetical protein|nr:hypothetical protein [Erysipelotrichaceae bacterium]